MGCRNTKDSKEAGSEEAEKAGKNVGNGSEFTGVPPATKSCEKLGVTSRQIFSLRQSWKGIKRNMEQTGLEMFVRLFKSNGELKTLFHEFKDLNTDDELRSNETLENHATLVMTTLDDAITHIDNYDYVAEVLRKTGASHHRFPGFNSHNFWQIREPFLDAVKITLEDRYTENMEAIYKIAITFILQTMVDGYEDHKNSNANTLTSAPAGDAEKAAT